MRPIMEITMDSQRIENRETLGLYRTLDKKIQGQLTMIADYLELAPNDCMTIRDLASFAGCEDDPALAVVLMVLFTTLDEGSLCLDLEPDAFLCRFPSHLRTDAQEFRASFLDHLSAGRYKDILAFDPGLYLPLVMDTAHGKNLLYIQKFFDHEHRLKHGVETFLSSENNDVLLPEQIESIINDLYTPSLAIRMGKNLEPMAKDDIQIKAIRLCLSNAFSIISGGPGTGKTSLMVTILRALVRSGIDPARIVLGAPTGRAAQRMSEAIQANMASVKHPTADDVALRGLTGATLHKILKYNGHSHTFHYNASNPLRATVVVLDEVSMVDLVMLETFLQAVDPSTTRLIFLGDKDQLPSVEAGAVFAEMIPDGTRAETFKERLVVLEQVYRSGTCLRDLARTINRGEVPDGTPLSMDEALAMDSDSWAYVFADDPENLEDAIRAWADHYYLKPRVSGGGTYRQWVRDAAGIRGLCETDEGKDLLRHLFDVVEQARILTLVRDGSRGCIGINAVIGHDLRQTLDPVAASWSPCFSGELIIITRNDYSKDLFNGDVGIILRDADGLYTAYFKRSETFVSIPVEGLPTWEPAFAMTVHKSQGSEFDDVFLVLPTDPEHRLLTREMVYTGITRAKSRVTVCGSSQAMTTALSRTINRQSGLHW